MRYESSVTSLSWIPSESVAGMYQLPFELTVTHYDPPPEGTLTDLESVERADRFRFANELRAWIEVEHGRIAGYGYRGVASAPRVRLGSRAMTFAAVASLGMQREPEVGGGWGRLVHTAGGRRIPDAVSGRATSGGGDHRAYSLDHAGADDPRRRSRRA